MDSMILTFMILSPLLGILALFFVKEQQSKLIRIITLLATLPAMIISRYLYFIFDDQHTGFQFEQVVDWFHINLTQQQSLNFSYSLGVDGVSMAFILLTSFVAFIASFALYVIRKNVKEFAMLLLLLETGALGLFCSTDFLLFFLFFEITLVVAFLMISVWSVRESRSTAFSFLLFNGLGSVFMLLGIMGCLFIASSLQFEDIRSSISSVMSDLDSFNPKLQVLFGVIFGSLLLSLAIKLPIFPFHSWMVKVHANASPPVVILHSAILLKVGAYGLLRFGFGFFPGYMQDLSLVFVVLGLGGLIYGGLLAYIQRDIRLLLAYSSISHMGLITLAFASVNATTLQGVVMQSIAHGLISALLFFIVGAIYMRTRSTFLDEFSGFAKPTPYLAGFVIFGSLALLGLPGFVSFMGEFMILLGLFPDWPVITSVAVFSLILGVIYSLRMGMQFSYGGTPQKWLGVHDLRWGEMVPILMLSLSILLLGIMPDILGNLVKPVFYLWTSIK